jgi:hypothetical protein
MDKEEDYQNLKIKKKLLILMLNVFHVVVILQVLLLHLKWLA